MAEMSGFTCTIDEEHFAVTACLCDFPLPLLCQSHVAKHSGPDHLLWPLEVVHSIKTPAQHQLCRQWLSHLTSNYTALQACGSQLSALEGKIESAYLEILEEVNRQREELIQGVRKTYAIFSARLETAIQTAWEHALDMTWQPTSSLAAAIWSKEAKELVNSAVYTCTVWANREQISTVFGAVLRFEAFEELRECGFGREIAKASSDKGLKDVKSELLIEELRQSRSTIKDLEAAYETASAQTQALGLRNEELVQQVEEQKQKSSVNRWFSEMEEEESAKKLSLEKELATLKRELDAYKAENAEKSGELLDLREKLANFQVKLPAKCVPFPSPLPELPLPLATLPPLPIEAVTFHPALQLPNGNVYIGHWNQQGERHGLGRCYDHTGSIWEGVWIHNQVTCWARVHHANENVYTGEIEHGKREGVGRMQYVDGSVYVGEFRRDKKQGCGVMRDTSKRRDYFGEWSEGVKQGKGAVFWHKGDLYAGDFSGDSLEGVGVKQTADGKVYSGHYVQNKFQALHSTVPSNRFFDISPPYTSTKLYRFLGDVELVERSLGAEGTAILRQVASRWIDFQTDLADVVVEVVIGNWFLGEEEVFRALRDMGCHFKDPSEV